MKKKLFFPLMILSLGCMLFSCSNESLTESETSVSEVDSELYKAHVDLNLIDQGHQNSIIFRISGRSDDLLNNFLLSHEFELNPIIEPDANENYGAHNGVQSQIDIQSPEADILIEPLIINLELDAIGYSVKVTKKALKLKSLSNIITYEEWKSGANQTYGVIYHRDTEPLHGIWYAWAYTSCWICGWNWENEVPAYLEEGEQDDYCASDAYKVKVRVATDYHSTSVYIVNFYVFCQ